VGIATQAASKMAEAISTRARIALPPAPTNALCDSTTPLITAARIKLTDPQTRIRP